MSYDLRRIDKFEQLRGEYLSGIASIEHNVTDFVKCLIKEKEYPTEFQNWFSRTIIRFDFKVDLLIAIIKEDSGLKRLRKLARLLHSHKDFRNLLAHSFSHFDKIVNSNGEVIPKEVLSYDLLQQKLRQLRYLDAYLLEIRSLSPEVVPISADDYADGVA
jgi:hypothetical protein